MAEKTIHFKSSTKFTGIFNFANFYKFCYDWMMEEIGMEFIEESKYAEKIKGDEKEIDVKWRGEKKLTDYFKFEMGVDFEIKMLKEIEIIKDGKKIKTNQGEVKMKVKGTLVKDYQGKFEKTALLKFLRSVYEKWVVTARVDQFENKIGEDCTEYLVQAKSWLDLEGK